MAPSFFFFFFFFFFWFIFFCFFLFSLPLPPFLLFQSSFPLDFLFYHTISCLENQFSRLPNLIFIISLKISSDLWGFEHLWKTHFQTFNFFFLPWYFLLGHLSSSHFMGRGMTHQLSGLMRRDFFKTHLIMLHTHPPKTSRWVHCLLFLLVNLSIFFFFLAWYLRNLWWALSFCCYLLYGNLECGMFWMKNFVCRHVDLIFFFFGYFWIVELFGFIKFGLCWWFVELCIVCRFGHCWLNFNFFDFQWVWKLWEFDVSARLSKLIFYGYGNFCFDG